MKISIQGLDIHYTDIGSGQPVLNIHGFMVDRHVMMGCLEPILSDGPYRRIYIDLPGMGDSQSDPRIASADRILDILVTFVDQVIGEENFLLTGQSYGGLLARGLVKAMPERIDGLLLLCPVVYADNDQRTVPEHQVLYHETALDALLEEDDDFEEFSVVQTVEIYNRSLAEVEVGLDKADEDFCGMLREKGYAFSGDVDDLAQPFTGPSLFLTGRQDAVVGYADTYGILSQYPRAAYAVVDMAGHSLQIEQPAVFNALVRDWLHRVKIG